MLDPFRLVEVLLQDPTALDRRQVRAGLGSVAELTAWVAGREVLFTHAA